MVRGTLRLHLGTGSRSVPSVKVYSILLLVRQSLNNGAKMNRFKAAICVSIVVISGCGRLQRSPTIAIDPGQSNPANDPTPAALPESARAIGMEFKLISAGTFTMG